MSKRKEKTYLLDRAIWDEFEKHSGNISEDEIAKICGCSTNKVSRSLSLYLMIRMNANKKESGVKRKNKINHK